MAKYMAFLFRYHCCTNILDCLVLFIKRKGGLSMNFDQELPIYLQIENLIKEKILLSIWKANERIPSVRDMASTLEVNPNTVMRTYERLQLAGILNTQRGLGYFINQNAVSLILEQKMQKFKDELPLLFKTMKILNITIESIVSEYNDFIKQDLK